MSRAMNLPQELDLSGGHDPINKPAFQALYDRYAPVLFGVITKTFPNKEEATVLLEKTFSTVHTKLSAFRPEKQPLFAWLLAIARQTTADALQARNKASYSAFQLTATGKIITSATSTVVSNRFDTNSTDSQLTALLDSVLFKKCTPEEAARTIGIPVETARQQLRLAVQQIQSQSQR